MTRRQGPRPVLKWAGGKAQLLDVIVGALPARCVTYYEPFVGGGAVFFRLAAERRFERAVLADRNPELVAVYQALQRNVEGLIERLGCLAERNDEDSYYEIREARPTGLLTRAARFIYLNKTGYNGLYRVNRAGQFNVPFGRYKRPRILDEPNLRAAAEALAGVELEVADFEPVCARARPGDAVYLDPPYVPLSRTSSFTAYDRHPFDLEAHERLAAVFRRLSEREVAAVLSNSKTPRTVALYEGFRQRTVQVARPINSRADARGPIPELLVVNDRARPGNRTRQQRRAH